MAASAGVSASDFAYVSSCPPEQDEDWITQTNAVRQLLCLKFGIPLEVYREHEREVVGKVVRALLEKNLLKHQGTKIFWGQPIPWELYESAFDVHPQTGMFFANQEDLIQCYDLLLLEKKSELDGRIFRPNTTCRVIATPRKFARTPRLSVSKSATARNLFSKNSVFNHPMMATPITARAVTPKTPATVENIAEQFATCQKDLEAYLSNTPEVATVSDDPETQRLIVGRTNSCLILLSEIDRSPPWSLGIKLYYRFLKTVLRLGSGKVAQELQAHLLKETQFHRALLAAAMEYVRFVYQIETVSFERIQRKLDTRAFELCIVLELTFQNSRMKFRIIQKRFKEIEERYLESELWKDRTFYDMLQSVRAETTGEEHRGKERASVVTKKKGGNGTAGTNEQPSPLAIFYADICGETPSAKGDATGSKSSRAIQQIFRRIRVLVTARLKILCQHLGLQDHMSEKALSYVEWVLSVEHKHGLLSNRNIDIIIICAIYVVIRQGGVRKTFKDIIAQYQNQPQCMDETFRSIFVKQDEPKVDIKTFYNRVFLPIFREFSKRADVSRSSAP
ncbi:Retinoblastoma- protein 1 [Borealophlyctis nickersoniae]|nr:Retinoblastoma- protein 1 [Borealophlyctis nickersoniae]